MTNNIEGMKIKVPRTRNTIINKYKGSEKANNTRDVNYMTSYKDNER